MLDIKDFLNLIYSLKVENKGSEFICLDKAIGRILADNIICKYSIPRFDNSAMDGYALKINYDSYDVVGNIFAGDNKSISIKDNEAYKITTGAKIPNGADSVIQQELTNVDGNKLTLNSPLKEGMNIKFKGEDFKENDILLFKGDKIDAKSIAILASQGINKVKVYKLPKIIILGSGNEVIPLDILDCKEENNHLINESSIYDINSIFLKAMLKDFCCDYGGVINDDKNIIYDTLKYAIDNYDIVITSGSASVGDKDYIFEVLKELKANILVDKINIKPGKPFKLSFLNKTFILSLPGNPIASFITFMLSVPNIATMISGGKKCYLSSISAINRTYFKLKANSCNAVLGNYANGEFNIFNNGKYQNSSFLPLVSSNAFAIFDMNVDEVLAGSKIFIITYDFIFLDIITSIINKY